MVNSVTSGSSSYPSPQPTFTSGAEAKANTQQVQPRQAPAADSQRSEQRLGREQDRGSESRSVSTSSPRTEAANDTRRGSNLDVVV